MFLWVFCFFFLNSLRIAELSNQTDPRMAFSIILEMVTSVEQNSGEDKFFLISSVCRTPHSLQALLGSPILK